jgi:hypothetical protein
VIIAKIVITILQECQVGGDKKKFILVVNDKAIAKQLFMKAEMKLQSNTHGFLMQRAD